jgi:hypothetical protein
MYYPNSQIETGLYTNGQEYVLSSTKESYIGYYWKTSSGKLYTGKTPQDKNIQELLPAEVSENKEYTNLTSEAFEPIPSLYLNPSNVLTEEYNKLNNKLREPSKIPVSFNPQPTEEDYTLGNFSRYFCKKTNELIYIEISKDTHDKLLKKSKTLLWQLYKPFKFQWVISGEKEKVFSYNESTVNFMIVKHKLTLLNQYLKNDYLKFWKK